MNKEQSSSVGAAEGFVAMDPKARGFVIPYAML